MNLLGLIESLRKFGYFIVGLFPFLERVFSYLGKCFTSIVEHKWVNKHWLAFTESEAGKALLKLFQRHYWMDYSADRLDLNKLPEDTTSALRIIFLLSIALCLLIPLALGGNFPTVEIVQSAGRESDGQIWSVLLWTLTTAIAWGAGIAGATISNRVVSTVLLVLYVTVFGTVAIFLPRDFSNVILPVSAFLAVVLMERSHRNHGLRDFIHAIVAAIVIGAPAGTYLMAITPLHAFNCGNVLLSGSILGVVISLFASMVARGSLTPLPEKEFKKQTTNVSRRVWIFSSLNLLFLVILAFRGGLSKFGSQLMETNSVFDGFLWPVWYFIGVGIIFKLLKNTKLVAKALEKTLPGYAFVPVVSLVILTSLVLGWSERVVATIDFNSTNQWTSYLVMPFIYVYKYSSPWLWKVPVVAMTMGLLKWFIALEFVALVWMAVKRRLTKESAGMLLYLMILASYLIYEYNFQFTSFSRSPSHSIALLCFFSISLLWMFHRLGLAMSLQASPLWPSSGRLPLYGAVLLFCLLKLHSQCALHNYNIMNQIFLIMFRGIIDVGFPYFLYVFATRKFKELPLRLSTIFGVFCLGGLITLPLNILDKLALSGWSFGGLKQLWDVQNDLAVNKGITSLPVFELPLLCLAIKSLIFCLALVIIAKKITRLEIKRMPSAILFATLAFASGIASFSKAMVDLPVPPNISSLIFPLVNELSLNANVFAIYLSHWLPTFIFVFCIAWKKTKSSLTWFFAAVAAFSTHLVLTSMWPSQEVFLRSTGLLTDAGVLLFLLLFYLIILALMKIEAATPDELKGDKEKRQPMVKRKELHGIVVVIFIGIVFHAYPAIESANAVRHHLAAVSREVSLPQRWGANIQKDARRKVDGGAGGDTKELVNAPAKLPGSFKIVEKGQVVAFIVFGIEKTGSSGNQELLKNIVKISKKTPNCGKFAVYDLQNWSNYYPGSEAMFASFEIVTPKFCIPKQSLTVLLPRTDGKTEVLSIVCDPLQLDRIIWEAKRVTKLSARSKYAGAKYGVLKLAKMAGE